MFPFVKDSYALVGKCYVDFSFMISGVSSLCQFFERQSRERCSLPHFMLRGQSQIAVSSFINASSLSLSVDLIGLYFIVCLYLVPSFRQKGHDHHHH